MFSTFALMSAPPEFVGISQAVYSFIPPTSLHLPVVSVGGAVTFDLKKVFDESFFLLDKSYALA